MPTRLSPECGEAPGNCVIRRLLLCAVLSFAYVPVFAEDQPVFPASTVSSIRTSKQSLSKASGLQAEMRGETEKALEIYKAILKKEPEQLDLWLRIVDIEWARGNAVESAEALQRALDLSPKNASLYYRLCQAYSIMDKKQQAFQAIEKAVTFAPRNIEYLQARGSLANELGKYHVARDSYKRILARAPDNEKALLDLARTQGWAGELDDAVIHYKKYCDHHPDDGEAMLDFIRVEGWRGAYPAALDLLEEYRKHFGETAEFRKVKAGILAWAGRSTEALELTDELLKGAPDDYNVLYSRTIALHYGNRRREALNSLEILEKLNPSAKETYDVRRLITIPIRPFLEIDWGFYHDSDGLDISRYSFKGGYSLSPDTRLEAGIENNILKARAESGLEAIAGDTSTDVREGRLGITHVFSPAIAAVVSAGGASAEGQSTITTHNLSADFRVKDNFLMTAGREYGYYIVSPRTVSLGIKRASNHIYLYWEPDINYKAELNSNYDTYSDNNRSWESVIGVRRFIVRGTKVDFEAGPLLSWQGFDMDLENGYYDPEFYQRYAVAGYTSWKITDDNAVNFIASVGEHKDNTMKDFRLSYAADLEGSFGIYRDWMAKIRSGIMNNFRQETGSFRAVTAGASLTRRF